MKITILTLFPEMFVGPFEHSIVKRARQAGKIEIVYRNIRDFGLGKHRVIDDKPYGGGVGMTMRVDVLSQAIKEVRDPKISSEKEQVILLDARGKTFKQSTAASFAALEHLILLCGHYEGVDERVREYVDQTISIGDFILTGGEIPAMLITDAVSRLVGGVLKEDATAFESFAKDQQGQLLEYPQYTLPREYDGHSVPEILLSGNHKEIENWRHEQAVKLTKHHRPDLLK